MENDQVNMSAKPKITPEDFSSEYYDALRHKSLSIGLQAPEGCPSLDFLRISEREFSLYLAVCDIDLKRQDVALKASHIV